MAECNFYTDIVSTLIGTTAGFVLGILSFYLTERWKKSSQTDLQLKSLKREITYNISQVDGWITDVESLMRKVSANDRMIHTYFRLGDFVRYFTAICFQAGILYEKLVDKEFAALGQCLTYFSVGTSDWINGELTNFREGRDDQPSALGKLEFAHKQMKDHRQTLVEVLAKL